MLILLKKEKVISCILTLVIIGLLFTVGNVISIKKIETVQTGAATSKPLPIYQVDTEEKKVALTINCAWEATDIDEILETLAKHEVKITFFMIGDFISKNETAVKKIVASGHEIANHSDTHPHVNNLSYEKNVEEIKKAADKIEQLTGKRSDLYRGPYGEYNDTVVKAAKDANHIMIQWSIDTLDYKGLTKEDMLARIIPKLENGSIILMHSGTKNTASSLDDILKNIKEKGFQIVPISELIYQEGTIDSKGIQHKI